MKLLLFIMLSLSAHLVLAKPVSPLLRIDMAESEKLIIKSNIGSLRVETWGNPLVTEFELVNGGSARLVPLRKEGSVYLTVDGNSSASTELIVKSSGRPLEIFWDKGAVVVDGWMGSVHLNGLDVKFSALGGQGSLRAHISSGRINLKNRAGSAHLASFKGAISATNHKGILKVENFAGQTNLNSVNGSVQLNQYQGSANLKALKGGLEFENGQGRLNVDGISGIIRGKSGKGRVKITVTDTERADVRSKSGEIDIRLPKKAGHRLYLKTGAGLITAPPYLSMTRQGKGRTMKGELRGSKEGSIRVVSAGGNIRVR